MSRYIPTGNEYVSLPQIREEDGSIESISFLYMAQKGMIELYGDSERPLFSPMIRRYKMADPGAAEILPITGIRWKREEFWLPSFTAKAGEYTVTLQIAAPLGQRGFMVRIGIEGDGAEALEVGLSGFWSRTVHRINQSKNMLGQKRAFLSPWSKDLVLEFINSGPLFALAFGSDGEMVNESRVLDDGIEFSVFRRFERSRNGEAAAVFFFGLGFEETAAVASVNDMRYKGWDAEFDRTRRWLSQRVKKLSSARLTELYNVNQFFCVFYSTGITLDSEQFVCVTSRSPRYYVSAAYWDRDTFLWAFPTLLQTDCALARQALEYAFTVQWRNIGTHSRYIDGTCLEFGFELDELVAPLIALLQFVETTGDYGFLRDHANKVEEALKKLETVKHPAVSLYSTFQQPTDDLCTYPYLTYDNVLVWYALNRLASMLPERFASCRQTADAIREAIWNNCVFADESGKSYLAWSIDLEGRHDVYDEPPGSLQLLPMYGFCGREDEIWLNTVRRIRSPEYRYSFAGMPIAEIGCPHAPYPWLLSICNSLLCGYEQQAFRELETVTLDNGIACESIDPLDGSCRTGAAFATCAGFFCKALLIADRGS